MSHDDEYLDGPPPGRGGRSAGGRPSKYEDFFQGLIDNPGKWRKLPGGTFSRRAATDIKKAMSPVPAKFRHMKFDAVSRDSGGEAANRAFIYVTYCPADAPQDSAEQPPGGDDLDFS